MAKKRKSSGKKHRFSPSHVEGAASVTAPAAGSGPVRPAASRPQTALTIGFATGQVVRRDLARVLLLAAGFTALIIVLWVLFTHTGLGAATYRAVTL